MPMVVVLVDCREKYSRYVCPSRCNCKYSNIASEKRNKMSRNTLLRDRKISSERVRIERIIGIGKTYKILTNPLNSTDTKISPHITFCC